MTVDEFLAANLHVAPPSDVELFDMFNVDMTESFYLRWNVETGRVERVAVMQRVSGQKQSERMLWRLSEPSPETLAEMAKRDREAYHAQVNAAYAANPEYELDLDGDVVAFATNLVKAGVLHPSHLLNDDGELD